MFCYLSSSGTLVGDKCNVCERAWQLSPSQRRESWPFWLTGVYIYILRYYLEARFAFSTPQCKCSVF